MKFSMIPENDTPVIKGVSKLWVVRRVLNPMAFWMCKLFFKTRLNWIAPALAVGAVAYLAAVYFLTGWWIKQQIITVAPWTYVKTAKASEMTTEQYIRLVFGKDAPTAIRVAQAESGMRCDAQHVNTDHSVDAGLFEINSVHLKKGWKLGELLSCHGNTDRAYEIFKAQGWCPWTTYKRMEPKKCK